MDDRRHAGGARHGAATARRAGAHRSLYARGRHRDDRRPLVGGVAAGDEAVERCQRRERRRHVGPDRIVELEAARRFGAGADVIGPQLLDRLFLHHVGEVQRATGAGRELIDAAHHALRPGGENCVLAVTRPAEAAIGRAAQFDAVEAFASRHGQVVALAAFDIDVPVGQLEIIVATGQARPVVDAGPRRLGDAVDALPHPFLQVLRIREFDLAHAGDRRIEQRRQALVPAVAVQPCLPLPLRVGSGQGPRFRLRRQRGDVGGGEHPVIDADIVDVGAAHEIVAALHLMRRQHAPRQAELVEAGVEVGSLILARDLLAIDVERHALRLVPGEGDMLPRLRIGDGRHAPRDADARQVRVGDEGVEAVAVPVDPQERHVPAGVIGEAGAEDDERRLA